MNQTNIYNIIAILVLSVLQFSSAIAQNKVKVTLINPPPNQLSVGDVWKMTLENLTDSTLNIYLSGTVTKDNNSVVDGTSATIMLPPGKSNYNYRSFETGSVNWYDNSLKEFILRTGNVPAGNYETCIQAFSSNNNTPLSTNTCIQPSIIRDPTATLNIISPSDGEEINTDETSVINFAWTGNGIEGPFTIKVVEMKDNQSKEAAMNENAVFFEKKNINTSSFNYPMNEKKFLNGKKYAWVVMSEIVQSDIYSFGSSIKKDGLKSITFIGKYYKKYYQPTNGEVQKRIPKAPFEICLKEKNTNNILAKTTTDLLGRFRFNEIKVPKSMQIEVGPVDPYICPCCYVFELLPHDPNYLTLIPIDESWPTLDFPTCGNDDGPLIVFNPPPHPDNCTFPPCPWEKEAFGILEAIDVFAESIDNNYPDIEESRVNLISLMKKSNIGNATIEKVLSRFKITTNQYSDSSSKITFISPKNNDEIDTEKGIMFDWRDCKMCPPPVSYSLRVVEIKGDQLPEDAMKTSPTVIEIEKINASSYQYLPNEKKLVPGNKYAWMLISRDVTSEIGLFTYGLHCACKDSDVCKGKCTNCRCDVKIVEPIKGNTVPK